MNAFFKQYGISKDTDIPAKYNSAVAEAYREKIIAEAEGRPYTPPSAAKLKAASRAAQPTRGGRKVCGGEDDWGDWGMENGKSKGSSEYSKSQLEASMANKESFFARKIQENASRPEGVRPSQGGKYVGFGSEPPPQRQAYDSGVDEVTAMLSKGWNNLSQMAGAAAVQAGASIRTGTEHFNAALKDGDVVEKMSHTTKTLAEKGKVLGHQGWTGLKGLYASVASKVEATAKDNGYSIDLGSRHIQTNNSRTGYQGGYQPAGYRNMHTSNSGSGFSGFGDDPGMDDDFESPKTIERPRKTSAGARNDARTSVGRDGNKDKWGGWEEDDDDDDDDNAGDDWGKW